jgi:uncharacterized Zn-finger protein
LFAKLGAVHAAGSASIVSSDKSRLAAYHKLAHFCNFEQATHALKSLIRSHITLLQTKTLPSWSGSSIDKYIYLLILINTTLSQASSSAHEIIVLLFGLSVSSITTNIFCSQSSSAFFIAHSRVFLNVLEFKEFVSCKIQSCSENSSPYQSHTAQRKKCLSPHIVLLLSIRFSSISFTNDKLSVTLGRLAIT